jgi:hypothetical protein
MYISLYFFCLVVASVVENVKAFAPGSSRRPFTSSRTVFEAQQKPLVSAISSNQYDAFESDPTLLNEVKRELSLIRNLPVLVVREELVALGLPHRYVCILLSLV